MNVIVVGGSGFIGRQMCSTLVNEGHSVTVLSRDPQQAASRLGGAISVQQWLPLQWGALEAVFEGKDAIINLAGEPIADARWTHPRKKILKESRVGTTRSIMNALANMKQKPSVLINASAIGYYGTGTSSPLEEQAPHGSDYLAELCIDWEKEASRAEELGLRVVCLRIGMVLGREGGALTKMLLPFRMFLGGPILPGNQIVSWIHVMDVAKLTAFVLEHTSIQGPVNAVAPQCVSMREFCQVLGRVIKRPSWLPVPAFLLKLGLGEMSTLMTTGQSISPGVAQRSGFHYSFPTIESALQQIFGRT